MSTLQDDARARIVALARGWIGTPYHHQASVKGVGTDCLGLVRGIWRELDGTDTHGPSTYTRDWSEVTGEETLLDAARAHLVEISPADAAPGDILIFRYRASLVAKHAGLVATSTTFIHAMEGVAVAEVALCGWWRRHIAAAFAFPGLASSETLSDAR